MRSNSETVVIQYRGSPGLLAGIFGCIFAVLGILTFGIIFIPLAVLCSIAGLIRGILGASISGICVSIIGIFLSICGYIVSPSLWLLTAGLALSH